MTSCSEKKFHHAHGFQGGRHPLKGKGQPKRMHTITRYLKPAKREKRRQSLAVAKTGQSQTSYSGGRKRVLQKEKKKKKKNL